MSVYLSSLVCAAGHKEEEGADRDIETEKVGLMLTESLKIKTDKLGNKE